MGGEDVIEQSGESGCYPERGDRVVVENTLKDGWRSGSHANR
jgi:hypothetical protein